MLHIDIDMTREELLAAALAGLRIQQRELEVRIGDLQARMSKPSADYVRGPYGEDKPAGTHRAKVRKTKGVVGKNSKSKSMSDEGKEKIRAAQKKRWAKYRQDQKAAAQPTKAKVARAGKPKAKAKVAKVAKVAKSRKPAVATPGVVTDTVAAA